MKQVMCVHLREFPIDRLRRRHSELRRKALVVVEETAHGQMVRAVSPEVPRAVRPGMTLAQARAHCAGLAVAPAEAQKDRRALEALSYWLMRFSPNVAVSPPAAIWLDATGLEMLFGNLQALAGRVDAALKRLQISANVAIGPTPGAAWGLAVFGQTSPVVVGHDNLANALARLPPEALRLEEATAVSLHALGISSIGILLGIGRDDLAVRFGPAVLERIDQAMGRVHEPLNWLPHRTPIQAEIEFDGVVESLDTLYLALRQVLDRVVAMLIERGLGARQLRLILRRPYAPPVEKTIGLLRSSRQAAGLFILLRHMLESVESDDGFSAVCLCVSGAQRLGDEQAALIGDEAARDAAELDHLIERLGAKFGAVVEWAQAVEAHVPEVAFSYRKEAAAIGKTPSVSWEPAQNSGPRTARLPYEINPPSHLQGEPGGPPPGQAIPKTSSVSARPLCLLALPCAIGVMVMPSESRDGQPVSFTHHDRVHRLVHVRGPERIAGQWWNGSGKTRDYFDVIDTGGSRFWLFRVMESNRWYLHGIFE